MFKKISTFFLGVALFAAIGGTSFAGETLTLIWAEWGPAEFLRELCLDFEKETGIKLNVEGTPWSDFQTKAFREFAAKGDSWDLIVGDSQWLGAGATQGHYVDLTDWFIKRGVDKSMTPAAVEYYAEYPKGSKKYWGVPLEGDAMGFTYRKDWFEDPKEKEAFLKKYGYELGVPKTWANLRDIAEFFYRPDQRRYGIAIYTGRDYDNLTMGIENPIFGFGSSLGNYKTYQVEGILNSKEGIDAVAFYKELYSFTPPDWGNRSYTACNQAFAEGLVALSAEFFSFAPALTNPALNKYAKGTGFFANPVGSSGTRSCALGGQGVSIVSYSKKRDLAYKFLDWFVREDVQKRWAELGGYSCNKNVLNSEWFLNDTPYNRPFYESMLVAKDFWAVPEYAELLEVCQRNWHEYVVAGKGTAKEAMDAIAKDWTAIFKKYGRLK